MLGALGILSGEKSTAKHAADSKESNERMGLARNVGLGLPDGGDDRRTFG